MSKRTAHLQTLPEELKEPENFLEVEEPVVTPVRQVYNSIVNIQLIFPAHVSYKGRNSGKLYDWPKAGDVVPVDSEDVADLLSKRVGSGSCCAGGDGNKVFIIYEM